MLDNSILLYGSNMSNSNAHNQYPLPTALVGGGAGSIRGGQHINFKERTPLANVLLTVLQRAGVPHRQGGRQHRRRRGDLGHGGFDAHGTPGSGGCRHDHALRQCARAVRG